MRFVGALALAAGLDGAASAAPLRVMSINQCTDQIVLALLPPERITSVTWLSRDPSGSAMAAQAARVKINHGLAEDVVRDRPDLVIAGSFSTPATRALLKKLNQPMLEVDSPDSFDGIRKVTRQIAKAVGAQARGEALIRDMDATLAELARTKGPPITIAAWDGTGFSARPGSLFDTLLTTAGARNVTSQTDLVSSAPSVELLLRTAPALLVRGAPAFETPDRRNDLAYHPLVRRYWHDRTVIVPLSAYICGTPYSAEAARTLRQDLIKAQAKAVRPLPFANGSSK